MPSFPRFFLATAALSLAVLSTSASASTIDFTGISGSNGSDFSTYTESGFTVTATAGNVYVGTTTGDSAPDIWAHNGTVTVTSSTGDFTFSGVDLEDPPAAEEYTITAFSMAPRFSRPVDL